MSSHDGSEAKPLEGWRLYDDGWVSLPPQWDDGPALHVRLRPNENGRLVITEMLLGDASGITADVLRLIQPARIEATFNLFDGSDPWSDEVNRRFRTPGPDDDVTLGDLRNRTPLQPLRAGDLDLSLERPDGTDPDRFYRKVGRAYSYYAGESRKPAALIAEQAGVPVTTVHRWIREARRRNFLPPAKKGTAG